MIRSGLDNFEATIYEETGIKKPKNLAYSNLAATSVDLTWTAGDSETAWELSYSTTSGDPDNGTIVSVSETSYSLTGLTAETTYYASVRAKVGEEYSAWTKEISFTPTRSVTLTVNDGTSTNSYIPVYGNYVDAYDKVEFIIPATDLADMANSDIKALTFYLASKASASWGNANFKIYMKEVDYTTITSYTFSDDDTVLYEGSLDGTQSEMAITLTTPYSYNGGNLLIGVYNTVKGTYKSSSFYGVSATSGASAYGTNSSSLASVTSVNKQSFLPKTTFTYLPVDGPVMKVSDTALDFGTITAESEAADKAKTFTISNKGNATLENISVSYTGDNVFSLSDGIATSIAEGGDDITVTVTMDTTTPGDYSGTITVSATDQTAVEIAVTGTYAANPATMAITLGEDAVGETVAFGNVGKQATKTFTVTNSGNLKLNITSIVSSNTTDFTVSPASLEVAGGSSENFTVTFLYDENARDVEKTANITVTASNEGIDPVVFAVTGTRIEQWSEDFSDNTQPDGWEITNSSYWKIEDGVAKGSYSYNNYDLITPSLVVEAGQTMTFDYRMTSTYRSLDIQYSKNNGTWTNYGTISYSGLTLNQWYTYTIEGLEAGNYKFRFGDSNYDLDNFEGFKRNMNDPKMGVYSDEECTTAVATSVSQDFGFATETQSATYYIKNDGTGTMTLALGDAPDGITQSLDKTSVTAGDKATLTITMPAENKGYNGGNVVVTATDLGTFTVAASGVIVDDTKMNLNFATDNIPTTWTTNSWSKNASGYAEVGYSSSPVTMQTSNLTAVAGEDLVVLAKMSSTYSTYSFGVKYKKTDAEEWSDLIPAANIGTSYVMLHGTIAEAGTYQLQFNGQYTQIQRIYGLSVPQVPVMVVYDGESVAASAYSFGNVSDEADATWTLTVKNEGKAELTGLAAALTGDNADHYSVEVSATTIAVNETATITVKQLKDNIGSHTATLTISATGLDNQVITLSGNTYDHTKLFVDFEDGNLPDGWIKGSYWSVSQVTGNTNHSLGHSYGSSYASSVITTPLTVAENEVLTFGASRYYSSYAPTLKVRYTADGGLTWSDYTDYSSEITSSYSGNTFKELTLEGVPAGTVVLEFYGAYVRLDNFYGFAATTAPLFALTESSAAVENNSTKEFGTLTAQATATYTLTNNGNGDMVSTVATTGVAAAAITTTESEGVTIADNKVTLAAGKSATITLTLPYAAPYGEKEGAMTITTEGWVGDFTVNYTAKTVDPTALYVDFADNAKPEGWYQDGWSFTSGYASAAYVANKQMITQKLTCAGPDDVLSFDVWPYTSSYGSYSNALTVEYSADRKNWTAFADQPAFDNEERQNGVQVSGAPAGDYYVRFTGSYVYMDNIAGWHKVTGIDHDLYVSTTTFPTAALIPGTSNGVAASATVYSLCAAEEGVYSKLFFDDTEMATTTKSIAKDGYETFTLTCNVPTEEKTYAAKIIVYYSDGTVAWETATTDVVVSQTRTLQITDFALTSAATVEADSENQFTSTFNVTVKNTGSIDYDAANVSVSVTDADGNAYGEATTWTAANSQTMFVVPGEYTNDNAVLAVYRFDTGEEDAEWAELTKISDNFYSAELNNKAKFIIVRLKNSEAEGYDATNNGLNWANMYNQSVDLVPGTANCFTFNGWDDKDGDKHYFGYSTMSQLAKGVSTTLKVTVTTSALEGGEFTFKAKENMSNTTYGTATVTVTAAAPKFALYQDATPVNDGDAVQFGIVKGTKDITFTIVNEGNKMLENPAISVPDGFEANYVAADGADADWMLFFYKDGTVDADQGNFKATSTDGKFIMENVNVPASGVNFAVHKKNGNDWTDIYGYSDEGGHLDAIAKATKLATATSATGWMTIAAGTYDFIWNATDLTLTAKPAGAILVGDSQDVNVTLKAEQGKISGDLVFTYPIDATTNKTFTLTLSGRSISDDTWAEDFENGSIPANWDNSNGWTVYEYDGNNVARMTGWDAEAIITPRLTAEKDDILTFDVLSLGNSISYAYSTDRTNWSDEVTVTATGEQTFTAPEDGDYFLRITARNAYIDNFVGFKLTEGITLDEADGTVPAEVGYQSTMVVKYTAKSGWNTICMPFELEAGILTTLFGEDYKIYELKGYNTATDVISFQTATSFSAGTPYLVYVATAASNPDGVTLNNVDVTTSDPSQVESSPVTFQGTFKSVAAGSLSDWYGVTNDGEIRKAGSGASLAGFRAYFTGIPAQTSARIAIIDEATGITTIVSKKDMDGDIYNLKGQKVQSTQKGLYIVNGKKVVIK